MRGVDVVVVAARVVGADDVWCWYVIVECFAGELFGLLWARSRGARGWGRPTHRGQGGRGPVGVDEWGVP